MAWKKNDYEFQFVVQTSGAQIVLSSVIYKVIYGL